MPLPTDVRPIAAELYFLPIELRMPLKFGAETMTSVTCARVKLTVQGRNGRTAEGWGETPLSVTWVWPSKHSYEARHAALKRFCEQLAGAWAEFTHSGHALVVGHEFLDRELPRLLDQFNAKLDGSLAPMPLLAALVCCSPFDIALHD